MDSSPALQQRGRQRAYHGIKRARRTRISIKTHASAAENWRHNAHVWRGASKHRDDGACAFVVARHGTCCGVTYGTLAGEEWAATRRVYQL